MARSFVSSMILEVQILSSEASQSSVNANLNLLIILSPTFSMKLSVMWSQGKLMPIEDCMISLSMQYLDSFVLSPHCISMAKRLLVLKQSRLQLLRKRKVTLLLSLALPILRQMCLFFSLLMIDLWQNYEQSSLVQFLALAEANFSSDCRLKLNCDFALTILLISRRLSASRKVRLGLCLGGTGRIFLLSSLLTMDRMWSQERRWHYSSFRSRRLNYSLRLVW